MTQKKMLVAIFFLIAVFLFLKYIMPYVAPFALSAFLAFLLEPIVTFLETRLKMGRGWAAILSMLIFSVVVGSIVVWSFTSLSTELTDLYERLPEYYTEFMEVMRNALEVSGEFSKNLPEPLASTVQGLWNSLYDALYGIVIGAGEMVKSVPGLSISAVFAVISTYLMIKDKDQIYESIGRAIPKERFGAFVTAENTIFASVSKVIRVEILLIIVTMIVNIIGLRIIGTRYAVGLGIILAVLDVIPIIGPGLIYIPWIIYHLAWGSGYLAVYLMVLYGGVSLMRQIARTSMIGKETGLHPLAALVSLYLGFRLFGGIGVIYGPLVAVLLAGFLSHDAHDAIDNKGGIDG